MKIHIHADVITIRAYEDGNCYHDRDPYAAIATGFVLDHEIYLNAAHGKVDYKTIKAMFKKLKEAGFISVRMERHGKVKVYKL